MIEKFKIMDRFYKSLVIISVFIVSHSLYVFFKAPYIGANLKLNEKGQVEIVDLDPAAWASKAGIKKGDILLELNGERIQGINIQLQQDSILKIKSQDGIKVLKVENLIFSEHSLYMLIIPLIIYFLCLFCSYFIYKSNEKINSISPYFLNIFLLFISLAYLSGSASARGDHVSQYLVLLFFISVPVIYLHFLYCYFLEFGNVLFNKKLIYAGYIIVFLNIVARIIEDFYNHLSLFTKFFSLFSFLVVFFISFVTKIVGLSKVKFSEIEYPVKVLIVTNVIAFSPFIVLYVIPYLFLEQAIFSPALLASFLLLVPFSLVYQFLSSKIYDIEFILGRVKYYALLSILPTIFLVAFIILLKEHNPKIYPIQLSIIIYILLIFVFYFKEIIDFRFRFKRFSEKYNYQDSILKYTLRIRKAGSLKQMMAELKSTILEVLKVSRAYCLVVHESGRIEMVDDDGDGGLLEIAPYEKDILNAVTEIGKIVEFDKGFVLTVGETNRRKYVIICLSVIKTPKLTRDEISWLNSLAFYTNVTVENFLKIEELMERLEKVEEGNSNPAWLKKLLFAIEEKQRSNLAKDLHDSVLQDLISLKRQCELVLEESGQYPAATIEKIQSMNQNILDIIHMTRETCQELRPQILYDLGLVKAVSKLVAQYEEQCNFQIRFNTGNFNKQLDINMQLNLYRIIQELLSNARKHSNAKQILIMLVNIREKIVLHYEDDGVGIDEELLYAKTESMGLSGIRERVKALDGEMKIETSPGNGFRVLIEI
ncbi:histidine kinase [Aeribacillus sp. FSL M8-0254]|uniref:histidine kinase n=1 Tax=Aeribacillus sp. FSL M8-0254 TaxID=2954577 RepID=UPI0030F6F006